MLGPSARALGRSSRGVWISEPLVDLGGGLAGGALLAQILYWFDNDRNGECRAKIERDGTVWLAKAHAEWWTECFVTAKQARSLLAEFETSGWIATKTWKFAGRPVTHITVLAALDDAILAALDLPSGQVDSADGQVDLPKRTRPIDRDPQQNSDSPKGESRARRPDPVERKFNSTWMLYPRKLNRKGALRAYRARIKAGVTHEELAEATDWYARGNTKLGTPADKIMHGATFYGPDDRWRDYADSNAPGVAGMREQMCQPSKPVSPGANGTTGTIARIRAQMNEQLPGAFIEATAELKKEST